MTKTKFCKILKRIEEVDKFDMNLHRLCYNFSNDQGVDIDISGFGSIMMNTVIDLLSEIMGDEDDWIGYYCWELNFGQDWTPNSITSNGESVDISTPEKLYDFLQENNSGE